MQFRSKENPFAAYQSHAKHKGFSIAIRRTVARLNAIQNDNGSWSISSVNHVHNHKLDPVNSVFMAAHRTLTVNMKRHLENNDIAGLRTSKSIRILQVQAGGPQNLGVDKKDCRNFVEQRRRLRLGASDTEAIHNLFLRLQKTDQFNEVVSFDTTYLVNKYDMPFATVVGINHHNQSILLGCALLSKENNESFKWFWSNWLEAMGNIVPTTILTDQCDGIKNALKEVMPDTIHHLCIWHILSKVPTKFKVVADPKEAGREFTELIYESITIPELELRIQSMHSFFDNYIDSRSSLKQFVEQYEIAVCDKVYIEMRADYDSKTRVIKCFSIFKWEEQFQKTYTNNIFQLIQNEIKGMWVCDITNVPIIGEDVEIFEVVDSGMMSKYHKQYTFTVEYRPKGEYLDCDCKKFNLKGILCRHIFKVLVKKNIDSVNERYIMRRWRKDVYRRHSSIYFAGGYPHMTKEYSRYQDVEKVFQECTDKSYQDESKMKFIKKTLKECSAKLDKMNSTSVAMQGEGEEASHNHVLDPEQINPNQDVTKAISIKLKQESNYQFIFGSGRPCNFVSLGIEELAGLSGLWPSRLVLVEWSHDVESSKGPLSGLNCHGSRSLERRRRRSLG
ncbi:hypothetical protein C2S51_010349 [Perilla frutescens var. frutescens]|nr:hypothetical protein C2S51_010349 [Perilla frutescens var. frutescens]